MTQIADVTVPEVFDPYVIERTADLAKVYLGGIVSADAELDKLALAGGNSINMPFWKDLSGDDEVLDDQGTGLVPSKIIAGQDEAALLMRGKAWTVNDLAASLSGSDPMAAIGNLVSEFWVRKFRSTLISSLDGVIASNIANNGGDMVMDLSGATNADIAPLTKFSASAFIDGLSTFNDAFDGVSGIAMHPNVYFAMQKLDETSFTKESVGDLTIQTYRGLRLIVDRKLPFTPAGGTLGTSTAPLYTTYLFGNGAFGLGQGAAKVPSESDRDATKGNDRLFTRNHFILHPRGVRNLRAVIAGKSQTNAELANGANWSRVYERENVRIAAIITNG